MTSIRTVPIVFLKSCVSAASMADPFFTNVTMIGSLGSLSMFRLTTWPNLRNVLNMLMGRTWLDYLSRGCMKNSRTWWNASISKMDLSFILGSTRMFLRFTKISLLSRMSTSLSSPNSISITFLGVSVGICRVYSRETGLFTPVLIISVINSSGSKSIGNPKMKQNLRSYPFTFLRASVRLIIFREGLSFSLSFSAVLLFTLFELDL
mmetsp:Transcript_101015/g.218144  ORF Transcript_101015/g.218144 Transcript_101015/m.218144 type:complete len:207 (+) Transcript_101015:370-990(+)